MKKLLNTLYVTTQGAYLHRDSETVVIEHEQQKILQVPIHMISSIICFGNVLCSPALLGFCSERSVSISFLTEYGRFLASVHGPISGNVLLRRNQYRMADNEESCRSISANIVTAKCANCRLIMHRAIRDHSEKIDTLSVKMASSSIERLIGQIDSAPNTDSIRGIEGMAAAEYFSIFNHMIVEQKDSFLFNVRNRRPPLDPVNALLSFIYTLLVHDIRSALESVGLDPAVGFLHKDRPGRPSLALDIMEEFRSVIADRLVLSLINRRQVNIKGFSRASSGAISMDDETRKTVLIEYQKRKQEEIYHPYIEETVQIGLLFFIQANVLARFIRGDIDGYPPFFWR